MCYDPFEVDAKFGAIVIKVDDLHTEDLEELAAKVAEFVSKAFAAPHEVQATRDRDAKHLYPLSDFDPFGKAGMGSLV